VTTAQPPAPDLYLVVGYDGSPPASRALDAAIRLLQGRAGRIDVVYVAHLTSVDMMSAGAVAELESTFDEVEQDLRTQAAKQLSGHEERWTFERYQGQIPAELLTAAARISEAHPEGTVSIVVGSSSSAAHRLIGSVAVSLARHAPVPVVIVP
jgi:nucleotide-binding universal stress UspA family protein